MILLNPIFTSHNRHDERSSQSFGCVLKSNFREMFFNSARKLVESFQISHRLIFSSFKKMTPSRKASFEFCEVF